MVKVKRLLCVFMILAIALVTHIYVSAKTNKQTFLLESSQTVFGDEIYKSNRFTQVDDLSIVLFDPNIPLGYDLVAADDFIQLYFNEDDYAFIVKDLSNDYLWYSVAPNIEDEDLSSTMEKLYSSFVVLQYYPYNENTERLTTSLKRRYIEDAEITTTLQDGGIDLHLEYESINISFTVEIRVSDGDLTVQIPDASIYEKNYNIVGIDLFPNFGATKSDEVPGYILIPDGPGALYRYKENGNQEPVQFSARYYGADQGVKLDSSTIENSAFSMPIIGMIHGVNQQGILGIVEAGEASAQFNLVPSGANGVPYNTSYVHFILRESYVYPTNNKGDGITTIPSQRFISNMGVRYRFLEDDQANYIGMAKSYREYLEDQEVLNLNIDNTVNLRVDIIQSDSEPGMVGMKSIYMTTLSEAQDIVNALTEENVELELVLRGWNKGGMSGQSPYIAKIASALGSKSKYTEWFKELEVDGVKVSLYVDYVSAFTSSKRPSGSMDLARGIYLRRIEFFDENALYTNQYLLDPVSTTSLLSKDTSFFSELGVNLSFNSIGSSLFSSYSDGYWWNREYSIAQYRYALSFYEPQSMVQPNAYLWDFASSYYDMPLYASQFSFYDDTVPFLQTVLRGKMDLYSPFMNFFANPEEQFLRLIDFGISPSYIVTEKPTTELRYSEASRYYTTTFDQWKPEMVETYTEIASVLNLVAGEDITSRVVLQTGVVKVTYTNGISILINYGDTSYTDGTYVVSPKGYTVEETS